MNERSGELLAFWKAAGHDRWFAADADFDAELRSRFLELQEQAATGRLAAWEGEADGALALVILLDQLPRNLFRGTPRAFATDAEARRVAGEALARQFDETVDPTLRSFFYLPFMHSEELADQQRCLALYRTAGAAEDMKYAEIHHDIIARFGRFPHRNPVLGRTMTEEEQAFLDAGGFAG